MKLNNDKFDLMLPHIAEFLRTQSLSSFCDLSRLVFQYPLHAWETRNRLEKLSLALSDLLDNVNGTYRSKNEEEVDWSVL